MNAGWCRYPQGVVRSYTRITSPRAGEVRRGGDASNRPQTSLLTSLTTLTTREENKGIGEYIGGYRSGGVGGEVVSAPPSEPPEAFPLREQMHRDIARRQAEYAEAGSLAEAVRRWVADGTLQPAVAEVLR